MHVAEQGLDLGRGADRTHRLTTAAAVAVHAATARIEEEAPRAVRTVRVERTRPVVAVRACTVETRPTAEAGGRQEETVAVCRGEESSVHAVLRRPYIRCVA